MRYGMNGDTSGTRVEACCLYLHRLQDTDSTKMAVLHFRRRKKYTAAQQAWVKCLYEAPQASGY